jgi:hypothetical protein
MRILKTITAALVLGLVCTASIPAWSAPSGSEKLTVAEAAPANPVVQAANSILAAPEFPQIRTQRKVLNNCKAGRIYSAHDIVGDPETCIMGSVSGVDGARVAPAL